MTRFDALRAEYASGKHARAPAFVIATNTAPRLDEDAVAALLPDVHVASRPQKTYRLVVVNVHTSPSDRHLALHAEGLSTSRRLVAELDGGVPGFAASKRRPKLAANVSWEERSWSIAAPLANALFDIGSYSLGFIHDFPHPPGRTVLGLGLALTYNAKRASLSAYYGSGNPISFDIYVRARPSALIGQDTLQP